MRTFIQEELEALVEAMPQREIEEFERRVTPFIPPQSQEDLNRLIREEIALLARLIGCRCPESIAETAIAMASAAQALGEENSDPEDGDFPELQSVLASFAEAAGQTSREKLQRRECTINVDDETVVCFCDEHLHYYPA